MFKVHASRMFLAMFALLVCAGMLQAQTPPASPLTATPSSVSVSWSKGTSTGTSQAVLVKVAAGTDAFVIDPSTVPFWLSLDILSGTATTAGQTVNFSASSNAGSLAAGNYSGSVHAKVSTFQDLLIPVAITVNDPASTLSVQTTTNLNFTWIPGTAIPTATLTAVSSDQPIAFSVSASNAAGNPATPNWISTNETTGIAYNFGSPVTVSFLPDVLNNAPVGTVLVGTVTITAGAQTFPETYNITIGEPPATITRIFPNQTPVHASGNLTVIVTGTGFGDATSPAPSGAVYTANPTTVTLQYGAGPTSGILGPSGIGGTVVVADSTTLILTIPFQDNAMPTPNAILAAGTVTIQIQNGALGSVVSIPLTVTTAPIIYSVTDAAALQEAAPGTNPSFAPYEMITIFGDNLDTGAAVSGAPDATFHKYPTTLTVPAAGGNPLSVSFYKQGVIGAGTHLADAPLLFVNNNQINAMVPAAVAGAGVTSLQIVVTYNAVPSTAYDATPIASNPGIFTTGSSGQGQGAIVLSNGTVNSSTSNSTKAVKGTSTVMVYLSGMGAPDSTATDTVSTKAATFPGACISVASFDTAVNPAWTSADGAIVQAAKIDAGHFAPCFATVKVTATIGGQAATVSYAGWVADSLAGLYQVNLAVPKAAASGNSIPVQVTVTTGGHSYSTQTGVTMAIQ